MLILPNIKVDDQKAPFSIGVGEGATPFPGLLHFTLERYEFPYTPNYGLNSITTSF